MADGESKKVMKRNGNPGLVKKDCVIEDPHGHATIHLWDDITEKCSNSKR